MEARRDLMTTSAQPASVAEAARCPTCGAKLHGDFCHRCGEKRHDERHLALRHFVLHALDEFTHLDSRIFTTLRYLFFRPGFLTREYVAGRRSPYMKPLSLFLLSCALFFLMDSFLPRSVYNVAWVMRADRSGALDRALTKLAQKKQLPREVMVERIEGTMHRISTAMQFANVLVLACILAVLYHKRYFVEHLVFSLHFFSLNYLAHVVLRPLTAPLEIYSRASILSSVITTGIFFAYLFLALRRVYRQGTAVTLLKTLVAVLGSIGIVVVTQIVTFVAGIIAVARP